jgi:hypothetical protein
MFSRILGKLIEPRNKYIILNMEDIPLLYLILAIVT